MTWQQPKTNWQGSDIPIDDDLNRIEGNIQDLKDNKVDKVEGKILSTNDYTDTEKNKLAGIQSGANYYSHPSTHPASMITGLPSSLPANGGNADTVDNKHAIDFVNAVASGSTTDPNTTQTSYILTNHANSPGLGKYWHIYTMFYSSKTSNRAQIALDYNHTGGYMYIRHCYSGTWTAWKKVWTQDTDGSGSGLDADTLDGKHASEFGTGGTFIEPYFGILKETYPFGSLAQLGIMAYYNGELFYADYVTTPKRIRAINIATGIYRNLDISVNSPFITYAKGYLWVGTSSTIYYVSPTLSVWDTSQKLSFSTGLSTLYGLAYDGTNWWAVGYISGYAFNLVKMNGTTGVKIASYSLTIPGYTTSVLPKGLAYYNGYLYTGIGNKLVKLNTSGTVVEVYDLGHLGLGSVQAVTTMEDDFLVYMYYNSEATGYRIVPKKVQLYAKEV